MPWPDKPLPVTESNTYPLTPKQPTPEQETVTKLREEGILVVFKTGAQEIAKLTTQVATTLRYFTDRDIVFFSDHQGSIGSFIIHDALRNVNQAVQSDNPDFDIYRAIKQYQATGRDIELLKEEDSKENDRDGWRLDKYKFIHMVEETFELRPDAKWYVFMETDTYMFWDNLVRWLKTLDHEKPTYLGSPAYVGDREFAHGGTGYVLSNAAMDLLVGPEQPQGLAASWDFRIQHEFYYGDFALAMALLEKGIHVTAGDPYLCGYKPSSLPFGPNNRWCEPVVTVHHMRSHEINNVWRFERQRERFQSKLPVTYASLYHHFVEPYLREHLNNWDNLSDDTTYTKVDDPEVKEDDKVDIHGQPDDSDNPDFDVSAGPMEYEETSRIDNGGLRRKNEYPSTNGLGGRSEGEKTHPYTSFEHCGKACSEHEGCFQYLHYDNTCKLRMSFSLGNYKAPSSDGNVIWRSGWMVTRIKKWVEEHACEEHVWPD
ncbi:uncharacterized protein BP5553_06475 [Venustampulla echinocandica]|uniref:Apple domain-containing protein n=1 Tax=Venustampulla echinocandica TaxID=2656787 RepID=A0A370TK15_9HELO|nr:uncharacterized protein BP5553_06475 [Venustampulla echinocandica]RDL35863.1 hypothetical protein BP5553_06475 [Venustampulla echinocandica]